ncbi:hypothetical protein HF521_003866, partial [Silurus meridionalis]
SSCRRSGTALRSVLRRQSRPFQLFSLATELSSLLSISLPQLFQRTRLPPRIVQRPFTREMGTQTSSDLPAVYHQETQPDNEDYHDYCIPASTLPSPPYPSCWSPTDYSPTSPFLSPDHYYPPISSPESDPDCSPMSSTAALAHKLFFPNKHAEV